MVTNLNWIFTQLKDVMVPMWIGHLLSWRIKWYQCELDIYSAEGLNGTNLNWIFTQLKDVMVPMWIGHLLSWRVKWYQCELDMNIFKWSLTSIPSRTRIKMFYFAYLTEASSVSKSSERYSSGIVDRSTPTFKYKKK